MKFHTVYTRPERTAVLPRLEKCYPSPHESVEDPPTLSHHSNFYTD